MLGVEQRNDLRRASLISEIYSESMAAAAATSGGAGGGGGGGIIGGARGYRPRPKGGKLHGLVGLSEYCPPNCKQYSQSKA